MADVADRAEVEEFSVAARIDVIRNQGRELYPKGECHYCEYEFGKGSPKLFCDSDCSSGHEASKRNR